MPMTQALLDRLDEAIARIERSIQRLATPLDVQYGALLNIRNPDREAAAVLRVETAARILNDVADTQEKSRRRFATTETETTTGDTLRSAILNASDDDLIALPGYGEKSFAALREWAGTPLAEPATDETQEMPAGTPEPAPNSTPTVATANDPGTGGRIVSSDASTGSATDAGRGKVRG